MDGNIYLERRDEQIVNETYQIGMPDLVIQVDLALLILLCHRSETIDHELIKGIIDLPTQVYPFPYHDVCVRADVFVCTSA
jgi:hypothetical protein